MAPIVLNIANLSLSPNPGLRVNPKVQNAVREFPKFPNCRKMDKLAVIWLQNINQKLKISIRLFLGSIRLKVSIRLANPIQMVKMLQLNLE